jgi:hypothetical protein
LSPGSRKATNDQQLIKIAEPFFSEAWNARCKSDKEVEAIFRSGLGFRVRGPALFANGPDLRNSLSNLLRRAVKVLGTKSGHEEDIEDAAWNHAIEVDGTSSSEVAKLFLKTLDGLGSTAFHYIAPNYAIHFTEGTGELVIGPVRALLSTTLLNIAHDNKDPRLEFKIGDNPGLSIPGRGIQQQPAKVFITLAPVSWEVEISASKGNVDEEALWLINLALSLLRLSYPAGRVPNFFPNYGEIETRATHRPETESQSVVVKKEDKTIYGGGWQAPRLYTINNALLAHHQTIGFSVRAREIFEYRERTVGERVAQGLGWMSRGRQAEARSERFLFFFTAIEALLSSADKTAPVIQTIARRAAVMISENPADRYELAKAILKQYETRSALVHGGRRNVSNIEAVDAQHLVETLYWRVLQKLPLTTSTEKFEEELNRASFGLAWPAG